MLEDQWPVRRVNQVEIEKAISLLQGNRKIVAVYFEGSDGKGAKKINKIDDSLNEIPFGSPYRISCAPGVFRRDFLLEITRDKSSPWDFERKISYDIRTKNVHIMELTKSNWKRIDETGAIYRGKWVPGVLKYAHEIGADINLGARKEMSLYDIVKRKTKDFVFNLSPKLICFIQNKLLTYKK